MLLYQASVPVFLHYLDRAEALVRKAEAREAALNARLAPDMFTAGQQLATAVGFALRGTYSLLGRALPDLPDLPPDVQGLRARIRAARGALSGLTREDFVGSEARIIKHRAGFAELEQGAADYLHLFAMPNFLFHLSMAFAVLRAEGLDVGKADFDGLHDYPHGFRF